MKKPSSSGLYSKIFLMILLLLIALPIAYSQYSNDDLNNPDFNWGNVTVNELSPDQVNSHWGDIPADKKDEYMSNPAVVDQNPQAADNYYTDANNLGKNPETDKKYFDDPQNVNDNLQTAQTYLSRMTINGQAALTIVTGVDYNASTNQLTNGRTTINLGQYGIRDRIEALPGGGFRINNVDIIGGDVSKTNMEYTITSPTGDKYTLTIPQQPAPGAPPTKVTSTSGGFLVEGPASGKITTAGGLTVEFSSRGGRFTVTADGTIAADDAKATAYGRFFDGKFITRGDETTLMPLTDGRQSMFNDPKNPLNIKIVTNGGDVQIHSEQLPSDAKEQPSLAESEARAMAAQPVTAINGEVWYKGTTVITKGYADVSGKDGAETFRFFGNGKEAYFQRNRDSQNPENTVTVAKGIFRLDISGRITADSTIYKGENPGQIFFSAYTTKKADAVTVDAPNDGLDAMKVTRYTHAYEKIIPGKGKAGISADLGTRNFDLIISKSQGNLNLRMTPETASFLGEARANPNIFLTMNGFKDFLLQDSKPEGDKTKTYFGLTEAGGLVESSGSYLNILGPGSVQKSIGGQTLISAEQGEKIKPFIQATLATEPSKLADIDLSGVDKKTLDILTGTDPAVKMLVSCINNENTCKNKDSFLQAYANLNSKRGANSVEEAQAYFDLVLLIPNTKPEPKITLDLVNYYLGKGDFKKADEINSQINDPNLNLYVEGISKINTLKRDAQDAKNQLDAQYAGKWEIKDGELKFHTENNQEQKAIESLLGKIALASSNNELGNTVAKLSTIDKDSPVYDDAKKIRQNLESAILTNIHNTANLQAADSYKALQERLSLPATFAAGGLNLLVKDYRDAAQEAMANNLIAQSAGVEFAQEANKAGISVYDISKMTTDDKIKLAKQIYPFADSQQTAIIISGLNSALQNSDMRELIRLEREGEAAKPQIAVGPYQLTPVSAYQPPSASFISGVSYAGGTEALQETTFEKAGGFAALTLASLALAPAGAAVTSRIGGVLATQFPKLAAFYAASPTLAGMGLEIAGQVGLQAGLGLFVNPTYAAIASGVVAVTPAGKAISKLREGEFVETLIENELRSLKIVGAEAGNVALQDEAGNIINVELKRLITSGEFTFKNPALQEAVDVAAAAEGETVERALRSEREEFFDNMQLAKISQEELDNINKRLGTEFILDDSGNIAGRGSWFEKAGAETQIPAGCLR